MFRKTVGFFLFGLHDICKWNKAILISFDTKKVDSSKERRNSQEENSISFIKTESFHIDKPVSVKKHVLCVSIAIRIQFDSKSIDALDGCAFAKHHNTDEVFHSIEMFRTGNHNVCHVHNYLSNTLSNRRITPIIYQRFNK